LWQTSFTLNREKKNQKISVSFKLKREELQQVKQTDLKYALCKFHLGKFDTLLQRRKKMDHAFEFDRLSTWCQRGSSYAIH